MCTFPRSQQRQGNKGIPQLTTMQRIGSFGSSLPHRSQWATAHGGPTGASSRSQAYSRTSELCYWRQCGLDLVPGFLPSAVNTVHPSLVHQRVEPELRQISWNFTKSFAFFPLRGMPSECITLSPKSSELFLIWFNFCVPLLVAFILQKFCNM